MAGLSITIQGKPIGDQQLVYTLSAEPADLTPQEIAVVLRMVAAQLDSGGMTKVT